MKYVILITLLFCSMFCMAGEAPKPEEHFYKRDGTPCTVAEWFSERREAEKEETPTTVEITVNKDGKDVVEKYTILVKYSGIDVRNPISVTKDEGKTYKLVVIENNVEVDFVPRIYKVIVLGPDNGMYKNYFKRFTTRVDGTDYKDVVNTKIVAKETIAEAQQVQEVPP